MVYQKFLRNPEKVIYIIILDLWDNICSIKEIINS